MTDSPDSTAGAAFRRLPSVDKVLASGPAAELSKEFPRELVVNVVREELDRQRLAIAAGKACPSIGEIAGLVAARVRALGKSSLRPLINATGVLLHTNLGRAPLSREAIAAMDEAARGYCNVEFDVESGARGSRHVHVEHILCRLTGAEAALVVNNNAAAVLLGLTALARRKEGIVSRGQAVEIGGGFRIPDVMRQSGVKLVEVGTTNCTYIADYEQAITPRTAVMVRVHSSNFKVVGFTHEVGVEEMAALGNRHGIPVLDDQGSGCFLDTTRFGLDSEPLVQRSVAAGCGLVLFSGDKLVGGPQAGIIVGKKAPVDRLKRHPLARAVRIDKVRLAALIATLVHYLKDEAVDKVPVWRMTAAPLAEIDRRATEWAQALGGLAEVVDGESMVGGGSLPGGTLPTRLVAVRGRRKGRNAAEELSRSLRRRQMPVVGRIGGDVLFLDPRSVLPEEDGLVLEALRDAASSFSLDGRRLG